MPQNLSPCRGGCGSVIVHKTQAHKKTGPPLVHPAAGLKTCGGFCVGPALPWGSHHASAVRCCFTASGWCVCRLPPGCSQAGCRQGDTLPGGHSGALPHQVSCQGPSTSSHTANKAAASLCLCVVVPLSRLPMHYLGFYDDLSHRLPKDSISCQPRGMS